MVATLSVSITLKEDLLSLSDVNQAIFMEPKILDVEYKLSNILDVIVSDGLVESLLELLHLLQVFSTQVDHWLLLDSRVSLHLLNIDVNLAYLRRSKNLVFKLLRVISVDLPLK